MISLVEAKRIMGLLVVLMAAVVLLSGPVLEVLGPGSEPVAEAKKKHKKKKKKKKNRPPAFNVVLCPGGSDCEGTAGNDFLVGSDSGEIIRGDGIRSEGGNDVYQGNGGNDTLFDGSTTSNDTYTGYEQSLAGFGSDSINDSGGSADFLDLGSLKLFDDVTVVRRDEPDPNPDDLILNAPRGNTIFLPDHFADDRRIEIIRFANGTITGTQAQSLAREATPEEQAAIQERLDEEGNSSSSGEEASS